MVSQKQYSFPDPSATQDDSWFYKKRQNKEIKEKIALSWYEPTLTPVSRHAKVLFFIEYRGKAYLSGSLSAKNRRLPLTALHWFLWNVKNSRYFSKSVGNVQLDQPQTWVRLCVYVTLTPRRLLHVNVSIVIRSVVTKSMLLLKKKKKKKKKRAAA